MLAMSLMEIETLRSKLRDMDEQFDRELRARGFDPAQADNLALPTVLARLNAEREEIKTRMEALITAQKGSMPQDD